MNQQLTKTYTLDEIDKIVQYIYEQLDQLSVITLAGPLGAGKTTLVQQLLIRCGIRESITSPTFTYMNIYRTENGKTFYHFDLYRISNLNQFIDAGFQEYLYQPNSLALIEWPEPIMPLLTHRVMHLSLDYDQEHRRSITIVHVP